MNTSHQIFSDLLPFHDQFGVSASDAIARMDGAGDDIPNQAATIPVRIGAVGCANKSTYFTLPGPDGIAQRQFAHVTAMVPVDPDQRGMHVSRLNDSIARISGLTHFRTIQEFTLALAEDVRTTQGAAQVNVSVRMQHIAPGEVEVIDGRPAKATQDDMVVICHAELNLDAVIISLGVEVAHITSCPCVQKTVKHATGVNSPLPLLTHSQRTVTQCVVHDVASHLSFLDILNSLDVILFRTRNTLPRPDEALLVYRSHETPQFIEDVVRTLGAQVARDLSAKCPGARIRIESRSMESIHSFDLVASHCVPVVGDAPLDIDGQSLGAV
ncbi:MAG: GTP cyclohydrolase, FolE2/MptA family [Actinomycetota bacterium]